jgi:hypothetical protein
MSLQEASISALTRQAERRVRSATFSHGVYAAIKREKLMVAVNPDGSACVIRFGDVAQTRNSFAQMECSEAFSWFHWCYLE